VSNDGAIVVGDSHTPNNTFTSFVWTHAGGFETLLTADPARQSDVVSMGMSGDGTAVVGLFNTDPLRGFRWTASSKAVELSPLPEGDTSFVTAVIFDGSVVLGSSNKKNLPSVYPVRWVDGVVSELPGFTSTSAPGAAKDVCDDGSVIVGNSDMDGHRRPFRWTVGDARLTALPFPAGRTDGDATYISGDGSVIVGATVDPFEAWRWSGGSVAPIFDLRFGASASPTGLNEDGTVVIGASENGPWIWDAVNGVRMLADFFTSVAIDYTGWTLTEVRAISADGKVLAGSGASPTGKSRAWIARLP
jgi:uncharacterized membrane protein